MSKRERLFWQAAYQNDIMIRQYERLQRAYTDNAMLFHDMDHHLQTIWHLASEGDTVAIQSYIDRISAPVKELSNVLWTGIGIVDAILNAKQELAQEKGFFMDIDVELPANTGIEADDYCAILANLLDNAIESMERQKGETLSKEPIRVCLRRINHFLMIQVSNPCVEQMRAGKGFFQSKKTDKQRHGWGLKSVKQAVLKYNGMFQCGMEDNRFVATAMLFFPKVKSGSGLDI